MSRVINIQETLSLPAIAGDYNDGKGGFCAWGAAFEACGELEISEYSSKKYPTTNASYFMDSLKDCGDELIEMNDQGEYDKARRLVIQLMLEKGFATPADSDLELARELMKEKANV